jgi:8-oxo-dGTP pyrophosphatase MutT (NUDIX family)
MKSERFRTIIDVHLLLIRDREILLAQRKETGYADDQWHMPSGHLEEGESAAVGAAREGHEETGIKINPESLQLDALQRRLPAQSSHGGAPLRTTDRFSGACSRCRFFRVDPAQLPRIEEMASNAEARLAEAKDRAWLGEVAALEESLQHLRQRRTEAEQRLSSLGLGARLELNQPGATGTTCVGGFGCSGWPTGRWEHAPEAELLRWPAGCGPPGTLSGSAMTGDHCRPVW